MSWILGLLTVLFVLDALRLRGRVDALPILVASEKAPSKKYRIVHAEGVGVPPEVVRAASARARAEKLDVIDLVPHDLPTLQAMGLAQMTDFGDYRRERFATGRTAGHAVLASVDVLKRAGVKSPTVEDPVAFHRLAARLKEYASTSAEVAVAPGLAARESEEDVDPSTRARVLRYLLGDAYMLWVLGTPLLLLFLLLGLVTSGVWGVLAVASFHVAPLVAFNDQALQPRDLVKAVALRIPWELWLWARTVRADPGDVDRRARVEEARPVYDQLLSGGLDRFFEVRRDTCPLCGEDDLDPLLDSPDRLQDKPGTFHLDVCGACGHVFQNPRLSIEGLGFYYRDFYDGLGREGMDAIFGAGAEPYHARARMMHHVEANPERWLDVGAGLGHFCAAARDIWPEARFDALDLSDNVEEAARRGWADHATRGLFPDVAGRIEGAYDVVSMSHYLEHTRDPRAELAAAHRTLRPGGHLVIELPDPECRFGRILGSFWLPWFQPQHQHLPSVEILEGLLEEAGFEALRWERAEPHQTVDLMFASFILLRRIGPVPDLPWKPRPTPWDRARHGLTWVLGFPLLPVAWGLDKLMAPFLRRPGWSNTYRVLARRTP
ncbi:MAG: class I SAM-dependent methyltransferase [Myxococcota bacterium]